MGEQVINLEELGNHRGSSYGMLRLPLTTAEQFENELALQWHGIDPSRPLWIEDESQMVAGNL